MATTSNLIQIKRSQSAGTPSSLANGELAWSSTSGQLFIGDFGTVRSIGGTRVPGTLVANQALIANSTGYIDYVKTNNLVATSLTANGVYNPGAGFLLAADSSGKIFWEDPTSFSVGSQYVQNTDSRVFSGNLVFSGSNTSFTGANVQFTGANTQINALNVTTINRNPTITVTGGVTGTVTLTNLNSATLSTTLSTVDLSSQTSGDYVADITAGNGISSLSGTGHGSTPTITVQAANGISVDSSGVNVKALSTGGLQVAASGVAVKSSNGITTDASGLQVQAYNGISVTSSGVAVNAANGIQVASGGVSVKASNGISVSTSGVYVVNADATVHVTSSGIYIGQAVETNSNVQFQQINATGNTTLGTSSATNVLTLNSQITGDIIPSADVTYSLGSPSARWKELYLSGASLHINSAIISSTAGSNTIFVGALVANAAVTANVGVFYHDVNIGGNLYVTGNVVSTNVETLSVADPLLFLGTNNSADTFDLGFYAQYNDGATKFAGLVRDASDKTFKLFSNVTSAPTTTVDFNSGTEGLLKAYFQAPGFVANGSVVNITATNQISSAIAANTLTLTTALGYQYGGTGIKTYNNGDLLVGNTTSGLYALSSGSTGGYLLQTDGAGALYWASLDGGTF